MKKLTPVSTSTTSTTSTTNDIIDQYHYISCQLYSKLYNDQMHTVHGTPIYWDIITLKHKTKLIERININKQKLKK